MSYENDDFKRTKRFTDSVTVSAHSPVLDYACYHIFRLLHIITLFLGIFCSFKEVTCHCCVTSLSL